MSSRRPSAASSVSATPTTYRSRSCATAAYPYGEQRPCHWKERTSLNSYALSHRRTPHGQRIRNRGGRIGPQKPWSEWVWWAREDLNRRHLPCQQLQGTAVRTVVFAGRARPWVRKLSALIASS